MTPHEATRTLVKSPPEVWAQCSDAEALERHLNGSFGEIRITRLEPETAVAWEGEQVRGTVQIEPSAWGTRVTLTAQMEEAEPPGEVESRPPAAEDPAREPEPAVAAAEAASSGESASRSCATGVPADDARLRGHGFPVERSRGLGSGGRDRRHPNVGVLDDHASTGSPKFGHEGRIAPPVAEEVAEQPAEPAELPPDPAERQPAAQGRRASLWARLTGRFRATPTLPVPEPEPQASPPVFDTAPAPPVEVAVPSPVTEPPAPPIEVVPPVTEPPAPPIEVAAVPPVTEEEQAPPDQVAAPAPDPVPPRPDTVEVLNAALESLGQAHHRPFSRA